MKVLLFSQVFYPDVVSVAQHLADLGADLSAAGHQVSALCSSRGYDNPAATFPAHERWHGVRIRRVWVWGLGKKSKLRRILTLASFLASSTFALAFFPRQDVVVVVPQLPMLSAMAALFVRIRGGKLLFWSMDLNPDEAIVAGWMKPDSLAARFLSAALGFSLRASSAIVVLDRFMKDRLVAKGVPASKIHTIPPWPHDDMVHFDPAGRASFRKEHGLDQKFVVMYSGNHSPLHPLDTLLQAAQLLKDNPAIAFVFIGGGSEFARVQQFARDHNLTNIQCLPYRPFDQLSGSLSAADLQVVLLGDPFVGIVHPCKIYNMLAVGAPFLYIGPSQSHIVDLRQYPLIERMGCFVHHGEAGRAAARIAEMASDFLSGISTRPTRPPDLDHFSQQSLTRSFVSLIESTAQIQ